MRLGRSFLVHLFSNKCYYEIHGLDRFFFLRTYSMFLFISFFFYLFLVYSCVPRSMVFAREKKDKTRSFVNILSLFLLSSFFLVKNISNDYCCTQSVFKRTNCLKRYFSIFIGPFIKCYY